MICYSDATISSSNRAVKDLIRFSRVTSAGFWSWFCKLTLFDTVISSQSLLFTSALRNQTGLYLLLTGKRRLHRRLMTNDRSHSFSGCRNIFWTPFAVLFGLIQSLASAVTHTACLRFAIDSVTEHNKALKLGYIALSHYLLREMN